jgi:hypothetical protein
MPKLRLSRTSVATLLAGSLKSPKWSALAMQEETQAGVASKSTPGRSPAASPVSTLPTQKVHFWTTPTRSGCAAAASCAVAAAAGK